MPQGARSFRAQGSTVTKRAAPAGTRPPPRRYRPDPAAAGQREHRGPATSSDPARVSEYIDRELLRLAARARRLETPQHWQLWAQAVRELGQERISKSLLRYVESLWRKKDLPEAQREALAVLRPLVETPSTQPSTQPRPSRP